jgi:MFS family permease
LVNAASFGAVLLSLCLMRTSELHRVPPQPPAKRQFRDGLEYVAHTRQLLAVLVLTALVFGIGWEFDVVLPLLAKFEFHGGAGLFGLMTSAVSVGAIIGTLLTASANTTSQRLLVGMGLFSALAFFAAALMPALLLEFLALVAVGAAVMGLGACCSSRLQLGARPDMRGRVMGLFAVACIGTRPVGGPLVGWVGQQYGARASLALGGVAMLIGVVGWAAVTHGSTEFEPAATPPPLLAEVAS